MEGIRLFVPYKTIIIPKSSHPWLNETCHKAILAKYQAYGTSSFTIKRDECSEILRQAHDRYIRQTSGKLTTMKASSKEWWKIADSLLRKPIGISSIPPLKRPDGTWARDGFSKATLLSETFRSKSQLPDPEINEFTPQALDLSELDDIEIEINESMVLPVLKKLYVNSGTGPD